MTTTVTTTTTTMTMTMARPVAAPGTATGTRPGNVDGRAVALTVVSGVRWWGRLWLPALFAVLSRVPRLLRVLEQLSFIHAARWCLVRDLPQEDRVAQQDRVARLRRPLLLFESNFNDGWEEYIDAFSYVLTRGMRYFWSSSYGFPGPLPTGPFKDYIRRHEFEADHFYSAYPTATTTMVRAALRLEPEVTALARRASALSPTEFADAWQAFVTDVQGDL